MGAKTPEGHQQTPNGHNSNDAIPINPRKDAISGSSASGDMDRGIIGEGDDDDDDDEKDEEDVTNLLSLSAGDADKKKKRRRSKKKGKKIAPGVALSQSSPPRVLLSTLFPSGIYPEGEIQIYNENTLRTTDEENRYTERQAVFDEKFLNDYRQAACAHRQVRQYSQKELIKPGNTLYDIAEGIEDAVRALTGHQGLEPGDGLKAGIAFPTGLCLNHIAAHSTPSPSGKKIVLQHDDVMKVDFGVHVNGRIVDSAFTVAFDPVYDNLLASVKDATNTGVKEAGIDARMSDIGAAIQEVMESYEVEIKGKTFPVKAIRSITGHDIKQYKIHGDKQVPFVKNSSRTIMEEGEVFAIETFGSTGRGYLRDDVGIYGYRRNTSVSAAHLPLSPSTKSLLQTIDANFGELVFNARYLERLGVKRYHLDMRNLVAHGIMDTYAPLVDVQGSYTAQFEHTILLHSTHKEVISRGEDY